MNVLIWVLAVLSLIGGTLAGFGEGEPILFAGGFVSFAMLGGFASVITLLKQMSSKISEMQNEETELLQRIADNTYTLKELIKEEKRTNPDSSKKASSTKAKGTQPPTVPKDADGLLNEDDLTAEEKKAIDMAIKDAGIKDADVLGTIMVDHDIDQYYVHFKSKKGIYTYTIDLNRQKVISAELEPN